MVQDCASRLETWFKLLGLHHSGIARIGSTWGKYRNLCTKAGECVDGCTSTDVDLH
jgi:hypothetical protein